MVPYEPPPGHPLPPGPDPRELSVVDCLTVYRERSRSRSPTRRTRRQEATSVDRVLVRGTAAELAVIFGRLRRDYTRISVMLVSHTGWVEADGQVRMRPLL